MAARVSVITIKRAYHDLERDGVLVTRQGRGTFVADNVELGRELQEQELDQHLGKAADVGRELGLGADELAMRLRDVARSKEVEGREEE